MRVRFPACARRTGLKASPDAPRTEFRPHGADRRRRIVIESPDHERNLADMTDEGILRVIDAWSARITDLKRDARFKYITVFKTKACWPARIGRTPTRK